MEKIIKELTCKTFLVDVAQYPLNFLIFPNRLTATAYVVCLANLNQIINEKLGKLGFVLFAGCVQKRFEKLEKYENERNVHKTKLLKNSLLLIANLLICF